MSTEAFINTKYEAKTSQHPIHHNMINRWCLRTAMEKQHDITLARRMSTPTEKKRERESHRWDYHFRGWDWWVVVRFRDGGLSAAGFDAALQCRAEQTDRWGLPDSCWTLYMRSAAPTLYCPSHNHSNALYILTLHPRYCAAHTGVNISIILRLNRANLQHFNKKKMRNWTPNLWFSLIRGVYFHTA